METIRLLNRESLYLDLADEALHTSVSDYEQIFNSINIKNDESIVDIGCGDGRGKVRFDELYPHCNFIGLEIVSQRLELARENALKAGTDLTGFINLDVSEEALPQGEYFFFYFPFTQWIHKVFAQIIEQEAGVIIIESHGDFIDKFERSYSQYYQLDKKIKLSSSRHNQFAHYYKFKKSTANMEQSLLQRARENENNIIEITQVDPLLGEISWIHSASDLDLCVKNDYWKVHSTNRGYCFKEITEIRRGSTQEKELLSYLNQDVSGSELRRVITRPEIILELANGRRTELVKSPFHK